MPDQNRDSTDEIVAEALRGARNSAFDVAIELCNDIALRGGCAKCCAIAIRQIQQHVDEHLSGMTAELIEKRPDKVN